MVGSNDRCCCRNGILCREWPNYSRCMVMLLFATCLVGAFIIKTLLDDAGTDDDDDMGGGLMTPVSVPTT